MTRKRLIIIFLCIAVMLLLSIQEKEKIEFEQHQQKLQETVEKDVFAGMEETDWKLVVDVSIGMHGQYGYKTMILQPDERGNIYLPAFTDLNYIRVYFTQEEDRRVFYSLESTSKQLQQIKSGDCLNLKQNFGGKSKNSHHVDFITMGDTGNRHYEYTFYQGSTNALFLSTRHGIEWLNESRDNLDYEAGMVLMDNIGQIQYDAPLLELKSRGNSTWNSAEKKPYQIKLGREEDTGYSRNLFGMGKHKTWLLLALWQEEGFMATATAYELAQDIGLTETSKMEFVDLYIDGEYRGLYGLTEKVLADEDGVPIRDLDEDYLALGVEMGTEAELTEEDNLFMVENGIYDYQYQQFELPEDFDYTSGYLIELDGNWFEGESCWFITRQGAPVVFKQPEIVNKEQMQYVSGLFQDLEDAIYSETGYNSKGGYIWDYADRDSWVKYFAVQEIMMNWDGYHSSTYFYVAVPDVGENPKIYAGPLWDMDHSAMPQNLQGFTFEESMEYNTKYIAPALYYNKEFRKELSQEFGGIYYSLSEILKEGGWFEQKTNEMNSSAEMDLIKWENANASDKAREKLRENLLRHAEWLLAEFR